MIIVHIGDSNTNGRPGWRSAYEAEWLKPGGVFEGWTSYNVGQNGSLLADWATAEIANCDDAAYRDLPAADYNLTDPGPGRLARALNADPDVVVLSLGTNDLNSPANRAGIGTEASLRTNLGALVDLLIARTSARIILRMPQPLAHEDFMGLTQWVDADEAAEASRRLRVVYREWIGQHQRVEVYDSHRLFGERCDDKTVDSQDPWGAGALIEDALHPHALGYRRMVQGIARQLAPGYPTPVIAVEPVALPEDAVWAVTLWCRSAALTSGTTTYPDFDLSPSNVIAGQDGPQAAADNQDNAVPVTHKALIEASAYLGNVAAFRELLAVPKKHKLLAYSHATGITTALTGLSLAQLVTNVTPHYAQLNLTALDLTGFGGGRVTFYVTDKSAAPWAPRSVVQASMTGTEKIFASPNLGDVIGAGAAIRKADGTSPTVSVYLQNQADGRYVYDTEVHAAPGKIVGSFTWSAWWQRAAFVFDATNYAAQSITLGGSNDVLYAKLTNGSLQAGAELYFSQ